MARPQSQSRPALLSSTSQSQTNKGRTRGALIAIAWITLVSLTFISVTYSLRIYAALVSDDDGGEGSIRGHSVRDAASLPVSRSKSSGRKKDGNGDGEPNYALLYPSSDCVGKPVRIPYSSSEKNCDHCRDFCSLHFSDREETANLLEHKSMFIVGDRGVQIMSVCLGSFAYKNSESLHVLRPGEGCVNFKGGAHASFV